MWLPNFGEYLMPHKLKRRVTRLIKENATSPEELAIVNIQLGEIVPDAVRWFPRDHEFSLAGENDFIGGQGQAVRNLPLPKLFQGNQSHAHLDIAKIAIVAANSGITSLGNFRMSDMPLDRQGFPVSQEAGECFGLLSDCLNFTSLLIKLQNLINVKCSCDDR